MPSTLEAAVLTVDVGLIHKVDTRNVENLFSMWSVFSRCASSLEEGRRLENLSWRLWNRETFCCDPVSDANATTPAISIASRISEGHYAPDVPELSSSLDSSSDDDVLEFDNCSSSTSEPLSIPRPRVYRQDSLSSSRSRGRERHITPDDLEKMVITIKEKKELEPLPTHSYLPAEPATPEVPSLPVMETPSIVEELTSDSASDHSSQAPATDSSCTSERSTTSIVKGFSPAHISNSYRSSHNIVPHLPSSIPTADIIAANAVSEGCIPKRKGAKFMLPSSGSDTGSSGHNNSVSMQQAQPAQPSKKKKVFQFGGSSNEDDLSLPSALAAGLQKPAKKQTSFKEEVATRIIRDQQPFDDDVFETDEDDIDESAIDDEDDSSEWEDSNEESNTASIDEKTFFKRVDSRPNLTSRPSLITLALNKNAALATPASRFNQGSRSTPILQRSRTSSPAGPSLAASPEEPLTMQGNLKSIAEIPIPQPIIMTTTNTHHHVALSPRTTRRNMLSTELTVSLRQHLLWERKQKSQTANAVLKRRHTAQDMANLKQYPEQVHMNRDEHDSNASYNQYFSQGLGEYHSKGW